MVAVPEAVGVHWKTRSGALAELPQLPAWVLVPVVVPLKVPPCAGMTVGVLQPAAGRVVVVELEGGAVVVVVVLGGVVVVVVAADGVAVGGKLPGAPLEPSTNVYQVGP